MRQKFKIQLDNKQSQVTISEYSVLESKDQNMFSHMCSELFDVDALKASMEKADHEFFNLIRTSRLFPPESHMEKITEAVKHVIKTKSGEPVEVVLDDKDLLIIRREEIDRAAELEELSDDDLDDDPDSVGGDDDDDDDSEFYGLLDEDDDDTDKKGNILDDGDDGDDDDSGDSDDTKK